MTYALYITHPQVVIDPDLAVPRWRLSDKGRARAETFASHPVVRQLTRIVSSTETKALELAAILGAASGAPVETGENFGENDRSSTGFLPSGRFEATADAFFAQPDESTEGWETARAAQQRIVAAVNAALESHDATRPIAFTGHGAVGTLLKCHLAARAIGRDEDQRRLADPGGGNVFAFRLADRALLTDWTAMERFVLPALG
ncbi:MAG: phosphoglycerate mutase family protein [Devosia sp.]|nr:phosphoglycerate mutase family protein [Devosia sp.]